MKKTLSLIAALTMWAAPAAAQQVTSISPTFLNDSPDAGVNVDNTRAGDVRVCWPGSTGTLDDGASPNRNCSDGDLSVLSGYRFVSATTPITPTTGTAFSLGTFYHYNNPLDNNDTVLERVDLALALTVGGQNVNGLWRFNHDETPNGRNGCCNDLVTISSLNVSPVTFMFGGASYTFSILGFGNTATSVTTTFSTVEDRTNSTQLWGVVNRNNTQVPEPASFALVGAGLLGLGAVARRRRA